jgi:Domain of unknown function (DUF4160)
LPTLSLFFGIAVRMYFDEHGPPHFHVYYGDYAAVLLIDTLEVREGRLPPRALALVLEWASAHRAELRDNWQRAERHEPLLAIEPLQ